MKTEPQVSTQKYEHISDSGDRSRISKDSKRYFNKKDRMNAAYFTLYQDRESYFVFDVIIQAQGSDGDGNGNPLQYSCLENPRDREVWWAAFYGIAQSCT